MVKTRNEKLKAAEKAATESSDDEDSMVGFVISTEGATEEVPEPAEGDEVEEEMPAKKKRKRSNKKKKVGIYKYDRSVESNLESFLFGKPKSEKPEKSSIRPNEEERSSDESSDESEDSTSGGQRKAAWHDEDDEVTTVKHVVETFSKAKGKHGKKAESTENYAESLRKQFKSLVDTPKWADLEFSVKAAADEDSDDEFFRETTDMLKSSTKDGALKKGILEFVKVKDMNELTHTEGNVIKSAEFHPHSAVGLVAGSNGTASLFQIDGKINPKMQTVNFENFPIKTAHFTTDGKQFMVGSQHFGHFFVYDMLAGKTLKVAWKEGDGQGSVQKFEMSPDGDLIAMLGRFGNIHFLSQRSKTKIFSLKMNDDVNSVAFSSGGDFLYSHGAGGEVYIWDVKAQECIHRFVDDGCIKGTAIAVSKSGRYLASGSDSGVVNIYDQSKIMHQNLPKPEKVVLNLTTPITGLRFNPTSELLALCSEVKENAVKMVHLPSMSVYQNFPSLNFNLKRPNCMDFSLNGGFFSLGNNRGAANLFRLKSFCNY